MTDPYYFCKRYEPQFEINHDRHHPNHMNSNITIKSKNNLPVELLDLNNFFKDMAKIYGGSINHFEFKHQVVFSAFLIRGLQKKTEQFIKLKVNQSLTWNDIEKYNLERELNGQIENLEMKDSS